jgi:hypothetical protein
MIVYNVTINVHDEVANDWLKWMKEIHIPMVMATGIFTSHAIFKLLTRQEDEDGTTFCIQYFCHTLEEYEKYKSDFAPALQEETTKKFAGKFHAFRSIMESV